MERHDGHVHLDEQEASGGSKEGVVRWVLAGGLLLAIILLSITWIVPALMGESEDEAPVSADTQATQDGAGMADATVTDLGDDTAATADDQTTMEDGIEVIEN